MGRSTTGADALSEAEVRARVVDDLVEAFGGMDEPVLVVHELGLGRGSARADLVVIHADAIIGVEIKSAADTLTRLPTQAGWYGRVCDRCILAGDACHVAAAAELLPSWWGLTDVDAAGVHQVRPTGHNPDQDHLALTNLLWMPELKTAVAEAGQAGGTAGMERSDLASVVAAAAGPRTGAIVRARLLERKWVDVADARGAVRVVRQPTPPKKVARRARVRAKYERRLLKDR